MQRLTWTLAAAAGVAALVALSGCPASGDTPPTPLDAGDVAPLGTTLGTHRRLGKPLVRGALTIWPVLTDTPLKTGTFLTLQAAQKKELAVVSELNASGQVSKLQVENKGDKPILILAGTVLKGGKQDRQIGQDFVVAPKSKVPVDAFCVEQGRWNASRGGKQTKGKFRALAKLAPSEVRGSGQYFNSQGRVWDRVARLNRRAGKSASSGTALATLDAKNDSKETVARRKATGEALDAHFAAAAKGRKGWVVVGFAYGINGKAVGVRAFANGALFRSQFPAYRDTIVLEADLARKQAKPTAVAKIKALIASPGKGKAQVRAGALNRNLYMRSKQAGNARCQIKLDGTWKTLCEDWTATPDAPAPKKQGVRQQRRNAPNNLPRGRW